MNPPTSRTLRWWRRKAALELPGLQETIEAKGLFCSFYTDRGSHYFVTPKAGGKVDKERPTQVGRALSQLGIEHIPSYSPQPGGGSSGSSARSRTVCRKSSGAVAVGSIPGSHLRSTD